MPSKSGMAMSMTGSFAFVLAMGSGSRASRRARTDGGLGGGPGLVLPRPWRRGRTRRGSAKVAPVLARRDVERAMESAVQCLDAPGTACGGDVAHALTCRLEQAPRRFHALGLHVRRGRDADLADRKSTRLNSS